MTGDGFLDEVTTHLLAAGGKRLRPVLALATATSGSPGATREDLLGAVAVELVHLASLYHDDVMDEATVRRNVESVNARFGNLVAIVAGDFLLARSAEIAAGLGTEIAALLAATLGELCQGQVAEVRSAFQVDRTEDSYSSHCRQDRVADGHVVPDRCPHGGPPRPRWTPSPFRPELRHGLPAPRRHPRRRRHRGGAGKAGGPGHRRGHLHPARPAGAGRSRRRPRAEPTARAPLGQPERDKARSIVAESGAVEGAALVARRYAEMAASAAVSGPSAELARAFAGLAHALVDDLPTG